MYDIFAVDFANSYGFFKGGRKKTFVPYGNASWDLQEAEANHGRALQGIFWFGLYRQATGYGEETENPIKRCQDNFSYENK